LVLQPNAHLLDMRVAVDDVDEDVADRVIRLVNGDPGPAVHRVAGEHLHGGGLVVRDGGQTDIPEPLPCRPLDLTQGCSIFNGSRSDDDGHAVTPLCTRTRSEAGGCTRALFTRRSGRDERHPSWAEIHPRCGLAAHKPRGRHASFKRQKRNEAATEIQELPNRGHSLVIDKGWPDVAEAALAFIKRHER
jgi:hypothetical protein